MPADASIAAKPSLALKRRIKAGPEKIFAAWTDPALITRWFCPEGIELLDVEADPRVGGGYRIVMRSPDGEVHDLSGVYREVTPPEKLVFTFAWKSTPERESLVTVALKPDGEGTLLTLTHEQFFDEAARDRHRDGWSSSLTKLEKLFA